MNTFLNKKNVRYILNGILVIMGTFCMGFAFNVFLNSKQISPSGFSGLCAIISNVLKSKFNVNIPASILYLAVNSVLFFLSLKKMGVNFAVNSGIGILSYALFIEICNFDIGLGNEDLLLCAIYGGVVMGIGLGLIFRGNGSTGGSDMLANLLNKKFKFLTVGNLVLIVDIIVVVLSFIVYRQLDLALYSLIAITVMTKMADLIVSGVQGVRAYYIVSLKSEEISNRIMEELHRGVTGLSAEGMYSKNQTKVLMTVITRQEASKIREIVAQIDRFAFMYSTPISEAMGSGFLQLEDLTKKTNKKEKNVKLLSENKNEENNNIVENLENVEISENKNSNKNKKN